MALHQSIDHLAVNLRTCVPTFPGAQRLVGDDKGDSRPVTAAHLRGAVSA